MTADRTAALEAAQIAAKLRAALPVKDDWDGFDPLMAEAADAIDALLSTAKEADRMREALEKIRECSRSWGGTTWVYNRAGMLADAALLPSEGTKT